MEGEKFSSSLNNILDFFFYIGRSLCVLSALFLKFSKFSNIKLIAGAPSRSTR